MKLEEGRITSKDSVLLITGFLFGTSLIFPPGLGAGNKAWLALLAGLAVAILLGLFFSVLLTRFPGKTLVEIAILTCGPVFGKLIALLFLIYLFYLGSLVMTNFLFFLKLLIYPLTPPAVLMMVIVVLAIYASWNGVEVISRCGLVLVPLTIIFIIATTLMLANQMELKSFKPLFEIEARKLIWASFGAATFPFGEVVAFLMILPFLNQPGKTRQTYVFGLLTGGGFLLLSLVRTIGVLGPTLSDYLFPAFTVGKMINVGTIFTRLEMLAGVNFVIMGFLKVVVLLYGTALGSAQIFRLKSYRMLLVPLGMLMLVLSLQNFSNVMENIVFARVTYPIYAPFFQLIIPLFLFIMALIRRLPRQAGG